MDVLEILFGLFVLAVCAPVALNIGGRAPRTAESAAGWPVPVWAKRPGTIQTAAWIPVVIAAAMVAEGAGAF